MPEATILMIDNSSTSINGDFSPNRLRAQTVAAERLLKSKMKTNLQNSYGIGTFSSLDSGIVTSLTIKHDHVIRSLDNIVSGGELQFETGIRRALLAFSKRDQQDDVKRLIAFVGSRFNLTEAAVDKLIEDALANNVTISIVAFGPDVNNLELLQKLVSATNTPGNFVTVPAGSVILSDAILSSEIGNKSPSDSNYDQFDDNPELTLALELSRNAMDDDIQEAIRASLAENQEMDVEDPDILEAIRISQQESLQQPTQKIDVEDQEIQQALLASLEENNKADQVEKRVRNPKEFKAIVDQLDDFDPEDPRNKKESQEKDKK